MMLLGLVVLIVIGVPALLACSYLALLTLLSWPPRIPPRSARGLKFALIIPAHDESDTIERVVASLQQMDWPADLFRIIVVADNCSDNTSALASAAGAEVLERHNAELRGKGHALNYAFAQGLAEGWADAFVIVDADTFVTPNLLDALASRIEQGAAAMQVNYGVANPGLSWRTRLLTIAQSAFHDVRSRAREHLGVSCGIRGNGWCVTADLIRRMPYDAYSLAEDLEFGITLGLAGIRVHYIDEAHVYADMVAGAQNAAQQRQRWEDGRFAQIKARSLPLLQAACKRRSAVCLDLAMDLLVLPLSYVALNLLALLIATALITPDGSLWWWLDAYCAAALILYVLRGWQLSKQGARGLLDLLRAPFFILWKLVVMLGRRRKSGWVRTQREKP